MRKIFIESIPLSQKIDYSGGTNAIYIGEAIPGSASSAAAWRIKKLTYDVNNNVTAVQWSPNFNTFGDIYDNRASFTYI
jgi:hypothetical protein